MYPRNRHMLASGYAPATEVAKALDKALSTIHRMAKHEKFKSARDGRALYIDLASVEGYYGKGETKNEKLASVIRDLRKSIAKETKAVA